MIPRGYEIRLIKTEGRQAKVWDGTANARGITIKHGIDGRKLRTRYIPLAQIPDGDSVRELENLAQIQQQYGYQLSWRGELPLQGSVRSGPEPGRPTAANPQKSQVIWELEPPEWFI